MEEIEAREGDLAPDSPIVLICHGGQRASMTECWLAPRGKDVRALEGGTQAWLKAGLPVVVSARTRWSLERQVRLAAGVLVLLGVVLALAVKPQWIYLSGFVGLGLTFAGVTDFCAMAGLLARMPWNRAVKLTPAPTQAKGDGVPDEPAFGSLGWSAVPCRTRRATMSPWTLRLWPTSTRTRSTGR
jgi:rhodanese-related sulfurtransferase